MTRVNLVHVEDLSHQHLVSEYRELPRVFGLVRRAQSRGLCPLTVVVPPEYTMGTGHVKFFYDKLSFVLVRQQALILEMLRRDYRPGNTTVDELVEGLEPHWFGSYVPTAEAVEISRGRLIEKRPDLYSSKEWRA